MEELELGPQLHTFVRVGVESTLERSQITRDHMGQLLLQLLRQGPLPKSQFIKGSVPLPPQTLDFLHLTRGSPGFLKLALAPTIQLCGWIWMCAFLPPSGLRKRWSRLMTWPSTSLTSGCTWPSC